MVDAKLQIHFSTFFLIDLDFSLKLALISDFSKRRAYFLQFGINTSVSGSSNGLDLKKN